MASNFTHRARVIKQQSTRQQPPQNTQQVSTKEDGAQNESEPQTSSQQVITGISLRNIMYLCAGKS